MASWPGLKVRFFAWLILAMALSLAAISQAGQAGAQSTNKPPSQAKSAVQAKKPRPIPFHGSVKAIDKTARTLTVGSRIFQITPKTRISKEGKAANLEAGKVTERVSGSYWKADDGKLIANSIYFGEKQPATKEKEPPQ